MLAKQTHLQDARVCWFSTSAVEPACKNYPGRQGKAVLQGVVLKARGQAPSQQRAPKLWGEAVLITRIRTPATSSCTLDHLPTLALHSDVMLQVLVKLFGL